MIEILAKQCSITLYESFHILKLPMMDKLFHIKLHKMKMNCDWEFKV